jgi:hypothetical protein
MIPRRLRGSWQLEPAFPGRHVRFGWPRAWLDTRREHTVDGQLDLAARQADVSEQAIVQRPQLGNGDPAPAPAGIGLEDEAADQLRQAQTVLPERLGQTGAAEGPGTPLAVGRGRLLAQFPVHQTIQSSPCVRPDPVHAPRHRLGPAPVRLGRADQMTVEAVPAGIVAPDHIVLHPELRSHSSFSMLDIASLYIGIVLPTSIEFLFICFRRKT